MNKKTEAFLKGIGESLKIPTLNYDPRTEGQIEGLMRTMIEEALWQVGDRISEMIDEYKDYDENMDFVGEQGMGDFDENGDSIEPRDEWQLKAETDLSTEDDRK